MSEKKLMRVSCDLDSLNYDNIDFAIKKLQDLKKNLESSEGATNITLSIDSSGYDRVEYNLEYYRPETDQEYEWRLGKEQEELEAAIKKEKKKLERKKINEDFEKAEYLRLKAKYE